MSTKKYTARNALTLKKKCELIDEAKKKPKIGSRALAEKFGCGKTQVNKILANQETILQQYEANVSTDCILLCKDLGHVSLVKLINLFTSGIH